MAYAAYVDGVRIGVSSSRGLADQVCADARSRAPAAIVFWIETKQAPELLPDSAWKATAVAPAAPAWQQERAAQRKRAHSQPADLFAPLEDAP